MKKERRMFAIDVVCELLLRLLLRCKCRYQNPGSSVSGAASYGRLKDFPGILNKKRSTDPGGRWAEGGGLLFRGFASKVNNSEWVSLFWSGFFQPVLQKQLPPVASSASRTPCWGPHPHPPPVSTT